MKKVFLMIFVIFAIGQLAQAQFVFDPFDVIPDSNANYFQPVYYGSVSDSSWVHSSLETSIVHEGSAAWRYAWQAERAESWGGYAKIEMWHPDSAGVWNFSAFQNLSVWYYNDIPSTDPTRVHLRIELYDVSDVAINTRDAGQTEFWYSFEYVLDSLAGWHEIVLPLEDVGASATQGFNGFWRTGWAGVTGNNHLDLNWIKGIGFEVSIDGPEEDGIYHGGEIIFDNLTFTGSRPMPLIFFNGKVIPSFITSYFAWSGALSVEPDMGHVPEHNGLKWVQSPGQAWTGNVMNFDPQFLSYRWPVDTLKFWIKAPTGTSTLRVQFDDIHGNKVKETFDEPPGGYNDTWTYIQIPLRDIDTFESGTSFDTSAVTTFEFMAEGTGNGYTIYFDDFWTGKPVLDVIAPLAPTGVFGVPGVHQNLVTWLDVPDETGEGYNVYYSKDPIIDVTAPGVDVVENGLGRPENEGSWNDLLFSPLADSAVSYYYAVTCVDAAGNEGPPGVSGLVTNLTAKGIGTMSLSVPAGFAADGILSEWSTIKELRILPSEGAHVVTNTSIDGDGDCSALVYLAGDADYFYFAFDMQDDIIDTSSTTSYYKDSPDLFIGLFNSHGPYHTAYGIASNTPDYQIRFLPDGVIEGKRGDVYLVHVGADYSWTLKFPTGGYIIEGRIAWADIAAISGDAQFNPVNGYRIPIDFSINDADGGGNRQGILAYSPYNDDTSWSSPQYWLYTWVGDRFFPTGINDGNGPKLYSYRLEQNYPNPFNPVTTINYSLQKQSQVELSVYNTLGQKVFTLVNGPQLAGQYAIPFNGTSLASGIYFYQLKAGEFSQIRKMVLMK
jgi:hypothetical protein